MFKQGLILPFWGLQHRYLPYVRQPFNCLEDVTLWRSLGYSQEHFTGEMYDMPNPMPEWTAKFLNVFLGINIGISFYRMNTCNILPYHQDTYKKYIELFNIKDTAKIYRAIIFLEDWKPGHIFEIESTPITNWKAGEYVLWQYDAAHMAANLGLEPRYTLQITYTDV